MTTSHGKGARDAPRTAGSSRRARSRETSGRLFFARCSPGVFQCPDRGYLTGVILALVTTVPRRVSGKPGRTPTLSSTSDTCSGTWTADAVTSAGNRGKQPQLARAH